MTLVGNSLCGDPRRLEPLVHPVDERLLVRDLPFDDLLRHQTPHTPRFAELMSVTVRASRAQARRTRCACDCSPHRR
jgi:hypothetical protein